MRNSFEKVLELIFVKCIFEFMINTAPPPSNSVYGREKLFWYDKITFWTHVCHCGAVVKKLFWMCRQTGFDSRRRCFLFLCIVFFLFGLFFLTLFFLLHSYCWPCWSCTWINIYFKLKSGVLFWKKKNASAFVHRLNHSYYYTKISTGSVAPTKKLNETFYWISGFNYRITGVYLMQY